MEPADIAAVVEGGGNIITYLVLYIAWKVNDIGKQLVDHDKRISALELVTPSSRSVAD